MTVADAPLHAAPAAAHAHGHHVEEHGAYA